ncbi:MAG: HNH endonuclease [Cyanomargarita calcarea GSE-NOS-MK-12-04C]|uniref:HNH endonuclease n=1 Tax=Cyanomargarita calcarea GSE-NOS-MK-12-04C TaxID=2839659 RepID=A0A951QII8_9CYAN|nr:HNH endonuclease [Cyanomargarita calcarea GSE-NOS-MK-12-04C]
MESFEAKILDLACKEPNYNNQYYAITFTTDPNGEVIRSCYSHFVGWHDPDEKKVELRAASLVRADRFVEIWRDISGEGCFIVDTVQDVAIFLLFGGHALVEKTVAEIEIPEAIEPHPVIWTEFGGFIDYLSLPEEVFNRAPSRKQRMKIFERDDFRCRICGRRPSDYTDIELHIHHIQPWAKGGITKNENLITLCQTYHKGLDPHYNPKLFDLIASSENITNLQQPSKDYWSRIQQYRNKITEIISNEEDVTTKKKQRNRKK